MLQEISRFIDAIVNAKGCSIVERSKDKIDELRVFLIQ